MLHIIRQGPRQEIFFSALDAVAGGQAVLLIEDAVYALLPDTQAYKALQGLPDDIALYALEVDLRARGLSTSAPRGVRCIDYLRMVDLCIEQPKVLSW